MRILFLTYQGHIAGSAMSISYLIRGLVDRGHAIYLGCRYNTPFYSLVESTGATLIDMPFSSRYDRKTMEMIRDVIRENNIQIINAQSSKDRYLAIFTRWRYNLDVRIIFTRRQMSKSSGLISRILYNSGTDGIIAVSEQVKRSLLTDGIRAGRIQVIPNGTPVDKYNNLDSQKTDRIRQELGIQRELPVLGCVSRRKLQDQLLEALILLEEPVQMIFIGTEQNENDRQIIARMNGRHRIHFLGVVDPSDVLSYYDLFDLFLLASTMEGLSQSLLEAMFLQVPVIATRAAGNIDLIEHEQTGLLFEDGDITTLTAQIKMLLSSPEKCKALTEEAYRMVRERYLMDRVLDDYESYFNDLLKEDYHDKR